MGTSTGLPPRGDPMLVFPLRVLAVAAREGRAASRTAAVRFLCGPVVLYVDCVTPKLATALRCSVSATREAANCGRWLAGIPGCHARPRIPSEGRQHSAIHAKSHAATRWTGRAWRGVSKRLGHRGQVDQKTLPVCARSYVLYSLF